MVGALISVSKHIRFGLVFGAAKPLMELTTFITTMHALCWKLHSEAWDSTLSLQAIPFYDTCSFSMAPPNANLEWHSYMLQ